ncbi:MAG: MBL fold metallo-hydrolase [Sphingobacteriaceae bacterium]
MNVTFLGTGTSQGVPVIACTCAVCTSADYRDKRLRSSILLQDEDKNIVIDSGPDFRYQMLRAGVKHLDGLVFTHEHKDHTAGLDDIRAFNYQQGEAINVYAHKRVQDALKQEFSYIFAHHKYPGVPQLDLFEIGHHPFEVAGVPFIPIEVMHFQLPVLGFRIADFTYITDAKTIIAAEKQKIKGSKVLVVNALQQEKHISHFTLAEALAFAEEMGAEKTYFTHISHRLGTHQEISNLLPAGVALAYDGLCINLS